MTDVPRPVPLAAMVPMRPDVRNAYELLCAAIRSEQDSRDDWGGEVPQSVTQPVVQQRMGWRLFCLSAFHDLLADQIKGEMTPKDDA